MTQLSEHFSLAEFTASQLAARSGIDNTPSAAELAQLVRLCTLILEPLRAAVGKPVVINSGYRSEKVNRLVGGAKNSHHTSGRAADIVVPGMTPLQVCEAIRDLELPYAQVIHEFGSWCHVSVAINVETSPRVLMTATARGGYVEYCAGLV